MDRVKLPLGIKATIMRQFTDFLVLTWLNSNERKDESTSKPASGFDGVKNA